MNHLCDHCESAPATHLCAQCIRSKYCSVSCQSQAWKSHHFISCRPFSFIAGREKHFNAFLNLNDEDLVELDSGIPENTFSMKIVEFDPTYWDYITSYRQLKHLYMLDLQLTSVPSSFGNLVNLVQLDLSRNFLKSLPREIGNLDSLQVLRLQDNNLLELPRELGNLIQLKELVISYNVNLTEIPPELGNLVNLEKLTMVGNNMTRLPRELGKLSNLKGLLLDSNQLTEIPQELKNLTNLYVLSIQRNRLSEETRRLILDMFSNRETRIYL